MGTNPARPKRRLLLAVLGGVVLVVVGGYAALAIFLGGEVPPGTRVDGVDIGGLSPAEARTRLEERLGPAAERPIAARAAGKTVKLKPQELGFGIDAGATVEQAMDGAMTPAGIARSLFGSRTVALVIRVDEGRLAERVGVLARSVDRKPKEGAVRYRGLLPQVSAPRPGRRLDQQASAAKLRAAFMKSTGRVDLPVGELPASATAAEVRRVADEVARPAVAAPLMLAAGGERATITAQQLAERLRFVADGQGSLRPDFDGDDLARDLGKQLVASDRLPKDASFKIVNGRPKVIPSRTGQGVDAAGLAKAVETAVAAGERTAEITLKQVQPRVTTELAGKLGIKEQVSSFTTHHPCCAPRVTNIHRIADIVDGYIVKPGETFSLNGLVGKRDKARGFVEAPMILNNRFVNDVGGGVSQFTTTLFNAVFFGGFQDVQHMAHQYYISRYPAGRESTISYPQPDFRFRNDSPHGILITTSYTGTSITVRFWSTKRYEVESESSGRYNVKSFPTLSESGPDCIPMPGAEGFTIDVWRVFKRDGEVVRRQKFTTVYQPEPRLTCD
ncbi:vanomycin resistance protein VanB [Nonomuraea sp. NN258]|uniref:VanW family protein n=1 Tax=Nonomuraea antri TaxID=2730852 RepID=UPI0015682A69|nr:VanW family protein [Nonomuraea antri]NRQ34684.1 vanomycin resistance protein VanB [Nonomuraea antri]